MITNEIKAGERLSFRINFNLINKGSAEHQIWLSSTINGKRARVYTKLRINPTHWYIPENKREGEGAIESSLFGKEVEKKCKNVNKGLKKIRQYCEDYAALVVRNNPISDDSDNIEFSAESLETYLKARLNGEKVEKHKPEVFIRNFIEQKRTTTNDDTGIYLAPGSIYNHTNALKRVLDFCKDEGYNLVWELFDDKFYKEFKIWCMKVRNYAPNTISTQTSKMKEWLSEADEKGYIWKKDYLEWPTKKYDTHHIYLTEVEIEAIYRLDFSNPEVNNQIDKKSNVEKTRDLFVLACWTGLRFGDWSDLSKAAIDKEFIRVPTSKTHNLTPIPLHPIVREIIAKYGGSLPIGVDKTHSIRHMKKCGELAKINSSTVVPIVRGGKEIKLNGQKWEFIGNHTARRSFATNQYLRNIPIQTIMTTTVNEERKQQIASHLSNLITENQSEPILDTELINEFAAEASLSLSREPEEELVEQLEEV